jgi:hypothetical protein
MFSHLTLLPSGDLSICQITARKKARQFLSPPRFFAFCQLGDPHHALRFLQDDPWIMAAIIVEKLTGAVVYSKIFFKEKTEFI